MSVVLTDNEFETVMKALFNAKSDFNFLHGIRVTKAPYCEYRWRLDCSQSYMLIDKAISVLDNLSKVGDSRD